MIFMFLYIHDVINLQDFHIKIYYSSKVRRFLTDMIQWLILILLALKLGDLV